MLVEGGVVEELVSEEGGGPVIEGFLEGREKV